LGLRRGSKGSRRGVAGAGQSARARQKAAAKAAATKAATALTQKELLFGNGDQAKGKEILALISGQAAKTAQQGQAIVAGQAAKRAKLTSSSQRAFAAKNTAKSVSRAASQAVLDIGGSSEIASLAGQLAVLERQKAVAIESNRLGIIGAQEAIKQRQAQARIPRSRGGSSSTKQLNRAVQNLKNLQSNLPKQLAQINSSISFVNNSISLRAAEQKRVTDAFARIEGNFGQRGVLPRSVSKLALPIDKRIRSLQTSLRTQGDIKKKFEIQQSINSLSIQRATTLARANEKFQASFEAQRKFKVASSRLSAQSAAIKQSEQRAVAASQGIAIGTIGRGSIANIVLPSGTIKTQVLPKSSEALSITPIAELNVRGGRDLSVELKETLSLTDKITKEKINALGGTDVNLNLTETLGFSDVKVAKPVDKITAAIAAQAKPIPAEDIAGKDFEVDIATGQVTEKVRLTQEAQVARVEAETKRLKEQSGAGLVFATPTDAALGLPTLLTPPPPPKKEVVLKAGEQPTADQIKGATSIVQLGTGLQPSKDVTEPVTTFFDNISNQVKSFTKGQEVIAKSSDNIIEKGLASIGVGAGKLGESIVSAAAVVPVGIEQGKVKEGLETSQDALFNIVTVQKQIAERGTDPIERGLANVAAFGAEASRQIVGDVAFALNISQQLSQEGRRASITQDGQFDFLRGVSTPLPAEQEIAVPSTLANVAIGEGVVGLVEARGFATSSDPLANLSKAFGPAAEAISANIESRGLAAGLGSIFALALPFNPKPFVPFRIVKTLGTTGKIIKTTQPTIVSTILNPTKNIFGKVIKETDTGIFAKRVSGGEKGVKTVSTPETVSLGRTLVFGKGGIRSKGLLSKTSEGFVLGSPTSFKRGTKAVVKFVEQIEPVGRGTELGTAGFASKVLTSPKVTSAKILAGKASEVGVELTALSKEFAKAIAKTPPAKQQKFLKATEQLTQAVEAGKESEALAKIIAKLPASKGGFGQSFLVIGERARKDVDIDFASLFRGEAKAIKAAQKAEQELTIASRADPTRKFTVSFKEGGPKLKSVGGSLGPNEKKVIEFLTKKDITDVQKLDSIGARGGEFLGQKISRGTTKIKLPFEQGAKVDTLQGQALKKFSSVLSEQGPKTESSISAGGSVEFLKEGFKDLTKTSKGFRIGPPDFRLKDIVDIAGKGQIAETLASTARAAGKTKIADELISLNNRFKKLFPEIDFQAVSKQADILEFGNVGKSEIGSAAALRSVASVAKETFPAVIPSAVGQVAKGSLSTTKGQSVIGSNVKKNIDISISSPTAKRTFESIGSIVTSKPTATTSKALSKALDSLGSIAKPSKSVGTIENSLTSLAEIGKRESLVQKLTSQPAAQSISSPSLLRGLDSIGTLPASKPSTSTLGIPKTDELDFGSIGSTQISALNKITVKSPSITSPPSASSKPVGSLTSPPIVPSVPSPFSPTSPTSPPSPPSTSVPKVPRGPSGASLVFGKSTVRKPPFVPKPPFLFALSKQDDRKKAKLPTFAKQLTFIADPADPLRAGVIQAKGVSQLVSGKAKIFKTIDKQLSAARQARGAVVPLGERIGIEKARIGAGPRKKPKKRKSKSKSKSRKRKR